MEANIKDYIINLDEMDSVKDKTKVRVKVKSEVEIVLSNETDLILAKETSLKRSELVLMLGQNLFYKKEISKKGKKEEIVKISGHYIRQELLAFFNRTISSYDDMELKFPIWLRKTKNKEFSNTIENTAYLSGLTKEFLSLYDNINKLRTLNYIEDNAAFFVINSLKENIDLFDLQDLKFATQCLACIVEERNCIQDYKTAIYHLFNSKNRRAFITFFSCLNSNDKKYLFKLIKENRDDFSINREIETAYINQDSVCSITNLNGEEINRLNINTFCNDFNLNPRKVIEYFIVSFKYQNLSKDHWDTIILYIDYLKMQNKMFGKVKDKYPRYLKSQHDIMNREYKLFKNEKLKVNIEDIMEPHKFLEYSDGEYSIILPKTGEEIMMEGINLHHCVKSYIEDVINGRVLILFLRESKSIEQSLITIEVRGEYIRQVKGAYNSSPSKEVSNFINKWAKEKSLVYDKDFY